MFSLLIKKFGRRNFETVRLRYAFLRFHRQFDAYLISMHGESIPNLVPKFALLQIFCHTLFPGRGSDHRFCTKFCLKFLRPFNKFRAEILKKEERGYKIFSNLILKKTAPRKRSAVSAGSLTTTRTRDESREQRRVVAPPNADVKHLELLQTQSS